MKLSPVLLLCAVMLLCGCSSYVYVPFSYPDNSLNIYNTFWDNFSGALEKGKTYAYANDGFGAELQFKVIQVLKNNTVLASRNHKNGKPYEFANYKTTICEAAQFLVISDYPYADGVKLRPGDYVCLGVTTYKSKGQKTLYVLAEKSYYGKYLKKQSR